MSEHARGIPRARAVRGALLALGIPQAAIGLWALVAPNGWYDTFPGAGREWLPEYGPYNEHFAVDIGSTFLALGTLLVVAAVVLERRVVQVALLAYLVYSLPHAIYHFATSDLLPTGDTIANDALLALTIAVPAMLLRLVGAGAGPRAAAGRTEAAR